MNKRNIVILIIISIILAISITNVSATTTKVPSKTIIEKCTNCGAQVTLYREDDVQDTIQDAIRDGLITKKNGKYYYELFTNYEYTGDCYKCDEYIDGGGTSYSKLVAVKKGDVIKKSNYKKYKTVESKGKEYTYYTYKKTVALSSSKVKTVSAKTKKLTAYYKKITMPTLKKGKYKMIIFKGQSIYYGRDSYYYVDSDYPDSIKVYAPGKWAQNTLKYTFTGFYFASKNTYKPAKPKWFKVYVKA